MKQIHEGVQALESDIGYWRPSWILLKKLKNAKRNYRANFLGPICILQIIWNNLSRGVQLYYQILMVVKMNKTEISAKIPKCKKNSMFLLLESHQKLISTGAGWGLPIEPKMKQIYKAVQALESYIWFWRPSWILLKKLENAKKNYRANSLGPICILQEYLEIIRAGVYS